MGRVADLEALSDLCTPWCLRVVVTLRIADRMAAGTTATADLAEAAGCDRVALGRVLGKDVVPAHVEAIENLPADHVLDPSRRVPLDTEHREYGQIRMRLRRELPCPVQVVARE